MPILLTLQSLRTEFRRRFGGECNVFSAPGRVNLMGEHTDYNDGYVLPVAIDFHTYVACGKTANNRLSVQSLQEPERGDFPVHQSDPQPLHNWTDYVRGVVIALSQHDCMFSGANLLIDGRVPIGAGLSSSAALEVAAALALLEVSQQSLDTRTIAKLCQRAENEFVGSGCGIMDQFASLHCRSGNALLLDCRSLDFRFTPIPDGVSLVICNSMVKHSVATGEYNVRRSECESAVAYFSQRLAGVAALRDVTKEDLQQHGDGLSDLLKRRCRHVISENARVLAATDALASADLRAFGQLMYESHDSLKNHFEVSCPEVDLLVELASTIPGLYGARMTGGGFGGCTINLVEKDKARNFAEQIAKDYRSATQMVPDVYITDAANGAGKATFID
jgi:galactokinase